MAAGGRSFRLRHAPAPPDRSQHGRGGRALRLTYDTIYGGQATISGTVFPGDFVFLIDPVNLRIVRSAQADVSGAYEFTHVSSRVYMILSRDMAWSHADLSSSDGTLPGAPTVGQLWPFK